MKRTMAAFCMAVSAALSCVGTLGAHATGAGDGEFDGIMSYSPGIPATGTADDTWVFESTYIVGAAVDAGGSTPSAFAGTLDCTGNGSGQDSLASGAGTMQLVCYTFNQVLSYTVSVSGIYERAGYVVTMTLAGTCQSGPTPYSCTLRLFADIVADSTTGTSVTSSLFYGAWAQTS